MLHARWENELLAALLATMVANIDGLWDPKGKICTRNKLKEDLLYRNIIHRIVANRNMDYGCPIMDFSITSQMFWPIWADQSNNL